MAAAEFEPRRFGKYLILERIAAGGMAEIYRARLDGIGGFQRSFAIKRIAPNLTGNPEFADMLVDEAKVAGLLSHANIVQILDLGNVEQQFYIAMEFVNGRDLGQVLARCAEKGITLPVPHAVFVLLEMLKGLEYAHNRQVMRGGKPVPLNIVHRDISPGNVLVSFQGEVKLTDFGIAKASVKALETMSGVIKGRFDYMSPEQALAQPIDQRSDLFSAGVLFYEVLTGRHPFRQAGELATLEAVRRGQYVPASEVNPDVPYALDVVVEKALRVRPDDRLQSATEFKEALDRFFHDSGFIFSASTLAAFVRGLFPEGVPNERRNASDAPTRPLEPEDMELEEDSSDRNPRITGRGGFEHRPPAGVSPDASTLRTAPPPRDPGASNTALSLLRDNGTLPTPPGDESTIIRSQKSLAAAAAGGENPFGEANTVIRNDPRAGDPAETLRLPLGASDPAQRRPAAAEPARARPAAAVPAPPVLPAATPARKARSGPVRIPVEVHALWALVCFAFTVAAFIFGLLLGSRMHRAPAPEAAPAGAASQEN